MAESDGVSRLPKQLGSLADKSSKKKSELSVGIKMENSSKECVQISNSLELALIEQKKENKRFTDEIENRKERFLKREKEYRVIIEDLQNEIKHKALPDIQENRKLEEAKDCHRLIMDNIDNIQVKTSKIILDQEKDILRFFNNKITEIKKQFEEERIKKGKKDQDYVEKELKLTSKLEWIKNIAQKIDNENHNLMKKYMDLKVQYQTQENDREMLLKELIMKKKKNAILKSQLEQYEQLLSEATKDVETGENDQNEFGKTGSSRKFKSLKQGNDNSKGFEKSGSSFKASSAYGMGLQQSEQLARSENTLRTLQSTLRKEQKRVKDLKLLYLKEIESKSELEDIIKKNVQKIKAEMGGGNNERTNSASSGNPRQQQLLGRTKQSGEKEATLTKEMRERLIQQLLNDDSVLTLVYDKTFYPELKHVQIDEHHDEDAEN